MSLTNENSQAIIPVPVSRPQIKIFFGGPRHGLAWSNGMFDASATNSVTQLIEQGALRQLAGTRILLFRMSADVSLSARFASLPSYQQEVLRAAVATSTVLVFSQRPEPPTLDDPVLFAFVEFSEGHDKILLDCYLTSLRKMQTKASDYFQNTMHPPAAIAAARASLAAAPMAISADAAPSPADIPYSLATHRLFVLLDLDKTLFSSDADINADQRHLFVPDVEIGGKMAVSDEGFRHRLMLRPGAHEFLRRLMLVAEVGVVTAGDLHYGRAAVSAANDRAWATTSPDESLPLGVLSDVRIPLTHVFSVRHQPREVLTKTFARVLPFVSMLQQAGLPVPVLAVDDKPSAWDASCRHQVLPISPFQPANNSPQCLLHIVEIIERTAAEYFGGSVGQAQTAA